MHSNRLEIILAVSMNLHLEVGLDGVISRSSCGLHLLTKMLAFLCCAGAGPTVATAMFLDFGCIYALSAAGIVFEGIGQQLLGEVYN